MFQIRASTSEDAVAHRASYFDNFVLDIRIIFLSDFLPQLLIYLSTSRVDPFFSQIFFFLIC